MKLDKTGRGFISLLCLCVVLLTVSPAWAANIDIGAGAVAGEGTDNDHNLAIGDGAAAGNGNENVGNVALGVNAQAGNGDKQQNNTAVGNNAVATGTNATAIGTNARATAENSVAVGAGSNTGDRMNTVSVGAPGAERQITNVADGVAPTDAVNVRQLDRVSLRLDRVGALAAAMSGLAPLAYNADEPTQGSIATGMYSGKAAIAAGLFHYTKEDVMLNTAFALSGSEKMGRLGVTFRFGKAKEKDISVTPATPSTPSAPATPATPAEVQEPAPVAVVIPEVEATANPSSELAITGNEVKG